MKIDLVKHEADKMRLSKDTYEAAQKAANAEGKGDYRLYPFDRRKLIDATGQAEADAVKLINDLEQAGYLKAFNRRECILTNDGIRAAERYIYESSSLAKRRKLQAGAAGLFGKMFESTISKLASLIGAFLAGVIFGKIDFQAVWQAVKEVLGVS